QIARIGLYQLHPSEARDIVFYIGEHVAWQVELAVALKRAQDVGCRYARRGRVPQRQRCDAVGVDVLRAFLKLREPRQFVACGLVEGVVYFQEERAIALDY